MKCIHSNKEFLASVCWMHTMWARAHLLGTMGVGVCVPYFY